MMTNYYLLIIVYKSSMRVEFIIIDKQEDLPTEAAMKGRLHGSTKLEEFILTNGDIIVSHKDIHIEAPNIPLNEYATELYATDSKKLTWEIESVEVEKVTGNSLVQIYGHCYLIKNWITF